MKYTPGVREKQVRCKLGGDSLCLHSSPGLKPGAFWRLLVRTSEQTPHALTQGGGARTGKPLLLLGFLGKGVGEGEVYR
jgi:hypothetical protein